MNRLVTNKRLKTMIILVTNKRLKNTVHLIPLHTQPSLHDAVYAKETLKSGKVRVLPYILYNK